MEWKLRAKWDFKKRCDVGICMMNLLLAKIIPVIASSSFPGFIFGIFLPGRERLSSSRGFSYLWKPSSDYDLNHFRHSLSSLCVSTFQGIFQTTLSAQSVSYMKSKASSHLHYSRIESMGANERHRKRDCTESGQGEFGEIMQNRYSSRHCQGCLPEPGNKTSMKIWKKRKSRKENEMKATSWQP